MLQACLKHVAFLLAIKLTDQINRACRAEELSTGKRNAITLRSRNTQRAHSAPFPSPPRAAGGSRDQPHREEKPARVDLILAYIEQTPM